MPISLYMDHNVRGQVTSGLRSRGVDVLTAYEDGNRGTEDPDLLDRATVLQRVFFTNDEDFLSEGAKRQRGGIPFVGVIYAHQDLNRVSIGTSIRDLERIVKTETLESMMNRVVYLPL